MSDDDLIRRGDAEKAMLPFVHNVIAEDAIAAIRVLPAAMGPDDLVEVIEKVTKIVDDWEHQAGERDPRDPMKSQIYEEAASIRFLIARIAAQGAQLDTWRRNSRDTFDAMVAMRNSINEHVPMPSLESDLLQGPENSVFCATVAEFVVRHIAAQEAQIKGMEVYRKIAAEAERVAAYEKKRAEAAETALAAERAKVARLVEALQHEVKRSRRHLAASTLAALEAAITEAGQ